MALRLPVLSQCVLTAPVLSRQVKFTWHDVRHMQLLHGVHALPPQRGAPFSVPVAFMRPAAVPLQAAGRRRRREVQPDSRQGPASQQSTLCLGG